MSPEAARAALEDLRAQGADLLDVADQLAAMLVEEAVVAALEGAELASSPGIAKALSVRAVEVRAVADALGRARGRR